MHAPTLIAVALIGALMILECDLGRHRVTWFRLLRAPLVSLVLILPLAPAPSFSGSSLVVEAVGIAIGAAVAVVAMRLLTVYAKDGVAWQRAAWAYAFAVLGFAALRCIFSFGAEYWFPDWLTSQIIDNNIDPDAFANSVVYVSLAFSITRTVTIAVRAHRHGWPPRKPANATAAEVSASSDRSVRQLR